MLQSQEGSESSIRVLFNFYAWKTGKIFVLWPTISQINRILQSLYHWKCLTGEDLHRISYSPHEQHSGEIGCHSAAARFFCSFCVNSPLAVPSAEYHSLHTAPIHTKTSLTADHSSSYQIFIYYLMWLSMKWIMKKRYKRSPGLSWVLSKASKSVEQKVWYCTFICNTL